MVSIDWWVPIDRLRGFYLLIISLSFVSLQINRLVEIRNGNTGTKIYWNQHTNTSDDHLNVNAVLDHWSKNATLKPEDQTGQDLLYGQWGSSFVPTTSDKSCLFHYIMLGLMFLQILAWSCKKCKKKMCKIHVILLRSCKFIIEKSLST